MGIDRYARGLLGLWLGLVVAGCDSVSDGHWTDAGTHLVDGTWVGPQIGCPPGSNECAVIAVGAQRGLPEAERSQVTQVSWVSLPTHFVTNGGEPRTPRIRWGVETFEAALVTLADGRQRVIGLSCELSYVRIGVLSGDSSCQPTTLTDWRDGAVPPSFPPRTTG